MLLLILLLLIVLLLLLLLLLSVAPTASAHTPAAQHRVEHSSYQPHPSTHPTVAPPLPTAVRVAGQGLLHDVGKHSQGKAPKPTGLCRHGATGIRGKHWGGEEPALCRHAQAVVTQIEHASPGACVACQPVGLPFALATALGKVSRVTRPLVRVEAAVEHHVVEVEWRVVDQRRIHHSRCRCRCRCDAARG